MIRFLKFLFRIIIFLTILGAIGIAVSFSVKWVQEDEFIVEIDNSNKVVKRCLGPGIQFTPWALNFKNVKIKYFPIFGIRNFDVSVMLPQLAELNDKTYSLTIPVDLSYTVIPKKFTIQYSQLDSDLVYSKLNSMIISEFSKEINSMFSEDYNSENIESYFSQIESNVFKNIQKNSEIYGIKITALRRSGGIKFPSKEAYLKGLEFKQELHELRLKQNIENEILKNSMKQKSITEDHEFDKLKKMSDIIKDNPLILKYIYIDKIQPVVNMKLPLSKSGYPLELEELDNKKVPSKKEDGDIDNLK